MRSQDVDILNSGLMGLLLSLIAPSPMDLSVKQALAKWPNVPAVYGWLSLDERGRWHIHEQGDANVGGSGEPITNPQILAFISRNYAADEQGRWFFQNGPQRVFVRLDAAPYVLRLADNGHQLMTHTGESIAHIDGWWLDEEGRLYATTDLGGGLIDGRDLERVLAGLSIEPTNTPLLDAIEQQHATLQTSALSVHHTDYDDPAPFHCGVNHGDIPTQLGFVANPVPPSS